MGKPAAFVCAIALGIILIASGDTGDEDALLKPNVTTESTSVEENASQKTTVKNGNNLAEESTYPDNDTPEETKSNEKPQQKGDCGKEDGKKSRPGGGTRSKGSSAGKGQNRRAKGRGEESKSSDIDDPVGTKGKGKSRQQPQQKGNCEEGNQKDLNSDGGTKMKNSTRKGRNKQDRNEDKLTEDASVNDTSFELVTTAQLPGEMFESYTNSNSSVCAPPPEIEGAVNPEIEGMNHPPGTSVTYSCPLGYVSRNTINHISFCRINEATRRAEWTVPEINCSPRSCGDPGYVNNGRRIGNLFTFPNKVEYECEEGYKLRGLNSRYCQAGGEWSGRLPTCEQIYCNIPEDPINGRVTYSSLEYGTELNYECNVGFLVTEHQRRICSENGIWSNEKPECIEATCEEPQPPKHGTVKLHGDLKVGTLATYSCDPGRRLYGATTTKCLISGKWTFAAPECLNSCNVPFIQNGEMGRYETKHTRWSSYQEFKKVFSGENVNSGETLTLKCKRGYLPVENSEFVKNNRSEVTCGDGTWSKDLQCKQTHCNGEPPPSKNARPVINSREHGNTIWYQCTRSPHVKIPGNVTCHLGSWIGIPPRCLSQPCYRKDLNYPGLIKPAEENFDSFESFQINCEIGYRKRPGLQKITCARGKWEISESPCMHEDEEGRIITTTETIKTSQKGEMKPIISVESSSPQTTDAKHNGDCSCILNYEAPSVKAQIGNKILKKGNTIKLGETVSLGCKYDNRILVWRNGFRFAGNVHMTCSTCKKWGSNDLPTCRDPTGDTYTSVLEGNLKILPGGIIDVPMGEQRRFLCVSSWSRPQWDLIGRRNVVANAHQTMRDGTTFYISYIDIVQAEVGNTGTYHCFLRGDFGTKLGSSYLHLQVKVPEDRSISTPQPRVTSPSRETQPSVNVETSSQETLDVKHNNSCCIYENDDQVVNAQIGDKILKYGDSIRQGEKVSFECRIIAMALTWENGLRLHGKVNMICNTCKKWQERDVPVCKNYEKSDTVISSDKDLNLLPGGIVTIQKGERHQFSCTSSLREPEWDFGQRKGVSVTKTPLPGSRSVHYISYLDIEKEVDQPDGEYECYMNDASGQRVGSTFLHLQTNELDIRCPPKNRSGIFTLKYSRDRRINSTVTFFCKANGKRIEGCSVLICLPNGTWSGSDPKCVDYVSCPKFPSSTEVQVTYSNDVSIGSLATFSCSISTNYLIGSNSSVCQGNRSWSNPLPSCEDPKCSINDLAMSIPEDVVPDILNDTQEYVTFGSEVRLKCSGNHVMTGDSKAQCGEQGKWKLGKFECVVGCLLNLDPSSHLIVTPMKDSYRVGEFAYPSCPPGEELTSKVERLMCLPGRWSDTLPECKEQKKKGQN